MGFKADTSFLRFLTMGAKGVHQTMVQLRKQGFSPIELERYCGSNKIWSTKVKRLRLPDLLCVKTGLRVEVRAKTALAIKMSDAPDNPDRTWDAGLQDDDLAAFIACNDYGDGPVPAQEAMFVRVGDMRAAVQQSKLGAPKSASEGAERDREWPSTVPKRSGEVIEVTDTKLVVRQFATEHKPERRQTYQLKGRKPYVNVGDHFTAGSSFLAGTPQRLAQLNEFLDLTYDPFEALTSLNQVDRYSAVKSFPYRSDDVTKVIAALEKLISTEQEERIKLEAAGSATHFDSSLGQDIISGIIWGDETSSDMRMEAILILSELGESEFTRDLLKSVAASERFQGSELRQAAIWGLGKAGFRNYASILPYIADKEENVALHAIAAFDRLTPGAVIDQLVAHLTSADEKLAPAASETLRIIGSPLVVQGLIQAYDISPQARNWIVATLGRMQPTLVREQIGEHALLSLLEPMFLCAPGSHWLSSQNIVSDISFLLNQGVSGPE